MKGVVNFEKLLNRKFLVCVNVFSAPLCALGAYGVKGAGLSALYAALAVGHVVMLVMNLRDRGQHRTEPTGLLHDGELDVVADDMRPEFSSGVPAGNVEGCYFVAEALDGYGALSIFPARYDAASDMWRKNDHEVLRKRYDSDLWMDADKQRAACERAAERARTRIESALWGTNRGAAT
jgi:hypothetical protein